MQHLMKNHDGSLSNEVGAAINAMGDDEKYLRCCWLMSTPERTLEEANCVAGSDKKLQFFLAQLKHDITTTTVVVMGRGSRVAAAKRLLETLSELWSPHGNSTFEGYLGNEGATKDTTFSRYAIIAWPTAHGVENAFKYINVNAAVEALESQRPVDAAMIRKFMDDVKAKQAQKEKSYSWPPTKTVSAGFASVDDFKNKDELAAPLTLLARDFEWNDIGQSLLDSFSKTYDDDSDVEFIGDSDDEVAAEEVVEETDNSCMKIALEIVDGLDTGAAQEALLKMAVEKASCLRQAELCSSKALYLLWKRVIRCDEKPMLDTVASNFEQTQPRLLQPVIESFSQHLGTLPASDDRFVALSSIENKRIECVFAGS
ncbi:hypothetical protein ON010_g6764 [Phytophthora cinnamomi]|nr:hypothetical protein ON010_g6764 [Phytophthora cinnamomi]